MLRRLIGPDAVSQSDLARDSGIPQATLSRWVREAGNVQSVSRNKRRPSPPAPATQEAGEPKRPQDWTPLERAEVVLKASALSGSELGAFLRERGLHHGQLDQWRDALEDAFSSQPTRSPRSVTDAKRIRELERDLARKDRALAETAALLILKKKMALFWGDEDDDTDPKSDE